MSATATPASAVEIVRADHAIVIRVMADMHAAYGRGVDLLIDAEPRLARGTGQHSTDVGLAAESRPHTVFYASFWDDGEVGISSEGQLITFGTRLQALDMFRVALHKYGYGPR